MSEFYEDFFIGKIRQGLISLKKTLSWQEEEVLLTPIDKLKDRTDFPPEQCKELNDKCIEGLKEKYTYDTANRNKHEALYWREMNGMVYKHSKRVLSGVVQNWYLTTGRKQEKQAAGCLTMVLTIIGCSILFMVFIFVLFKN